MCWTNYKNFIFYKIAKEDITCYKIFRAQEILQLTEKYNRKRLA